MTKNDEIWEKRAQNAEDKFTAHPVRYAGKWFLAFIALCAVVGIIFGVVSWVGSWGSTVARVSGAGNTEAQANYLFQAHNSLKAIAANVCGVVNAKKGESDPTLIEDPAFAYKAQYRDLKAQYDSRMDNFFQANLVRNYPMLNGLPRREPSLEEATAVLCP